MVRALIVIAAFLAVAGIAAAAVPQATTIEHTPAPVEALAQDGGVLAWLAGDGKKCNSIHMTSGGNTYTLPQPPTGGMTCTWNLSDGEEQLAIAAGANAALWTLHEKGSDFVETAFDSGKEIEVARLHHASDGTGLWLGGTAGSGNVLAYSSADEEYIDPLGCGLGGSCKKKIAGGEIDVVDSGQATALPGAGPALGLAISDGRLAYVPATTVGKNGAPASSPSISIPVVDASNGSTVSDAKAIGVPFAVGLSSHLLAVLSRGAKNLRLTWYDPATGERLGGIAVPAQTAPQLAVSDQAIVYRFGRALREVVPSTGHVRALGKTAAQYLGLSLDDGRLVWAENHRKSGRILALSVP